MCEHKTFFQKLKRVPSRVSFKGSSLVKGFQSKNDVMVKTSVSMKAFSSKLSGKGYSQKCYSTVHTSTLHTCLKFTL